MRPVQHVKSQTTKPLTSMAYAFYKATTGKEPPADLDRKKARAVVQNRMAKKRAWFKRHQACG